MKLVCTIGTQGLAGGRMISRGEVYEVDDETASTIVEAGYAQVVETDVPLTPVEEPEVVAASEKSEVVVAPDEPTIPEETEDVDKDSVPKTKQKGRNKRR